MAVEALSTLQDRNVYKTNAIEDDFASDGSIRLHTSDEDEEEDATLKIKDSTPPSVEEATKSSTETTQDDDKTLLDQLEQSDGDDKLDIEISKDEEKMLLGEDDDNKESAENTEENDKLDSVGVHEEKENAIDEKVDEFTNEDKESVNEEKNDKEKKEPLNAEKRKDSTDDKEEPKIDEVDKEESAIDGEKDESANGENEEKPKDDECSKKAESVEDVLKDQVMDTEDLLQIVEIEKQDSPAGSNVSDGEEKLDTESDEKLDTESEEKLDTESEEKLDADDEEKTDMDSDEKMDDKEEEDKDGSAAILLPTSKDSEEIDIEESTLIKGADADIDLEFCDLNGDSTESTSNIKGDNSDDITVAEDSDIKLASESNVVEEISIDTDLTKIDDMDTTPIKSDDSVTEDISHLKPVKRSADTSPSREDEVPKKLKLADETDVTTADDDKNKDDLSTTEPPPLINLKHLDVIEDYLKRKSLKKLTFKSLEQLIIQKICETICYQSEIGELRHQLAMQEKMADMWRKEMTQLQKQVKDLDIVNRKLLQEVRQKNEKNKPIVPVKITRSVGLQVRADCNGGAGMKRKAMGSSHVKPAVAAQQPNKVNVARNTNTVTGSNNTTVTSNNNKVQMINRVNNNSNLNKVNTNFKSVPNAVTSKIGISNKIALNGTSNSILKPPNTPTAKVKAVPPKILSSSNSNASSPSNGSATTPLTNGVAATNKPTPAKSGKAIASPNVKTVIDLTDEDDNNKNVSSSTVPATSPQNQTVRIVTTPIKTTNSLNSGVVNPPRIVYMYNNQIHQGVLAADSSKNGAPKLMLKLAPSSGGITTTSGSPITVTTTPIRTTPIQSTRSSNQGTSSRTSATNKWKHPAPLPLPPPNQPCPPSRKAIPPKPHLSIKRSNNGLVLSWKMPYSLDSYESIASYQLYAYQETSAQPTSEMWRKVGDVKALALPMACTLTQFADGNKYHFAVRAVDVMKRFGLFSDPEHILL